MARHRGRWMNVCSAGARAAGAKWAAAGPVRGVAGAALGLLLLMPATSMAQQGAAATGDSLGASEQEVLRVPLWMGEAFRYKVKYGIFGVGEGHMGVSRLDTIGGRTTYVAEMHIRGMGMDQKLYSWIDTEKLFSRRFVKEEEDRPREYDFYPEERRVHQIQHLDSTWSIGTSEPLDDIAFVYLARALPLEVGRIYEYHRYFKEERNPIILKVLRRDKRKVGAGEFNTIVVRPIIPESKLFAEGGNAEIHLSDDERRIVVYMKVDGPYLPFNFTLHLEEYQEGGALGDDGDTEERNGGEAGPERSGPRHPPVTRSR